MNNKKTFYITTTIPYVNAAPHIGFALEIVQADALARYQRLMGKEVFFSTGSDEYGQKIWEAAEAAGKEAQAYVDEYAAEFSKLKSALNLSNDNFIRTTAPLHIEAVQEFWRLCDKKGDVYKKLYKGLYCVGCEKFLKEKDLVNGKCPFHPNQTPEMIEEENYFFRFSNYEKELLAYLERKDVLIPSWRKEEAINFVKQGLEDFSISRNKKRLSWGVPVPGDDEHVMYVWFGAFVNYISTLGWHQNKDLFEKFWQEGHVVQVAGKDMVRFQSLMWQAMLMSAELKTTDQIFYHGFINSGGQKMSKSLGNVIDPFALVDEYGTDAVRYYLLRHIHPFDDSDMTLEKFKEVYNANLANGLGNLVSRVLTMSSNNTIQARPGDLALFEHDIYPFVEESQQMAAFEMNKAMDAIWARIGEADALIQTSQPFKLIKTDPEKATVDIQILLHYLIEISIKLKSFMPETAEKIEDLVKANKKPETPLFLRKE